MPTVTKGQRLYEGKAKILYATDQADRLIQEFKDDATAFNAQKRGTIAQKGIINNKISAALFQFLESKGIATHFVERLSDREMLVKQLSIIPLEVTVRNLAAGGLVKLLGIAEGTKLPAPLFEYHYKRDDLEDPLLNDDHIRFLGLLTPAEDVFIRRQSLAINRLLQEFFLARQIVLVDFKLEFGRHAGQILLGDEISPDTCRFWEVRTGEKLDKDRFRRDLGRVEEAYQEMLKRIVGEG